MKRLLLGLMLLVTAGAAMGEWTRVYDIDPFIQYVDRATIRRSGNFVKMWDLADFKTVQTSAAGDSYLSSTKQQEYDCKEEKVRILAFNYYSGQMGSGKPVYSYSDGDKWTPISPRTINELLWEIACGKQ